MQGRTDGLPRDWTRIARQAESLRTRHRRRVTRSGEQLRVGTETVDAGKARLRKYVVTGQQTVTVPVSHEEVRIER